jgi:UDP-N-acetylglucosamine 3-dehydrogenase
MATAAVVGTGYWGRNHVRTLIALRDEGLFDRLLIVEPNDVQAAAISDAFDVEVVPLEALSTHGVSMATVATPTGTHLDLTIRLMNMGIDVLVEKPIAMDAKEGVTMVDAAEATGRLLLVGHVFRHHAAVRKARTMIEEGAIGPVRQIITERMASREPRDDNGVIAALGIHDLDICCDLMGDLEPLTVTGMASPSIVDGIEDHAALQMRFPSVDGEPGAVAYITLSWRSRVRGKVRDLHILGRDGSISIDYLDHGGLWLHRHPGDAHGPEWGGFDAAPRERIEIPLGEPALTAELRDFVLRSTGRRSGPALNDAKVGLLGLQRVEQALRVTGFEAQLE